MAGKHGRLYTIPTSVADHSFEIFLCKDAVFIRYSRPSWPVQSPQLGQNGCECITVSSYSQPTQITGPGERKGSPLSCSARFGEM